MRVDEFETVEPDPRSGQDVLAFAALGALVATSFKDPKVVGYAHVMLDELKAQMTGDGHGLYSLLMSMHLVQMKDRDDAMTRMSRWITGAPAPSPRTTAQDRGR